MSLAHGLGLPAWLLALGVFLAVHAAGLGVVLGYHRLLTHRVARLPKLLERSIVTLGLPAGTPVQWIGNHRFHHVVADTEADPHSPTMHGFWRAHAGWYLDTHRVLPAVLYTFAGPLRALFDAFWRPRTNQQHVSRARDVAADPYYAWLSKPGSYGLAMLLYNGGLYAVIFTGFGLVGCAWMAGVHVLAYALGDLVNSLGHGTGPQAHACRDQSQNRWWLGVITFGDGFHNTHHAYPTSARAGLAWYELDVAYVFLCALEALGWAQDVRRPVCGDVVERRAA